MLFESPSYSAALAALLAEHDLGHIELVPQNSFAAELKEGIISAFRVGAREGRHFNQQDWIDRFNHSNRLVQLNFVAFGLNELGQDPTLESAWPRVNNPMALNSIEGKLYQAQRYLRRRHGVVVEIRDSRLELKDWGLAEEFRESEQRPVDAPNLTFVGTIPDSDFSKPIEFKFGDVVIAYHENPRTLGETVGIPPLFKYPQLAVVNAASATDPRRLVVRVEASGIGVPMLCSLDRAGNHKVLPSGKGCAPPDERADICVRGTQRGGGCGTTGNLQIVWREASCSRTCAPGELRQHSANDITSTRFAVVEGGEVAFRGTGSYRNCLASNSISMPSTPGK